MPRGFMIGKLGLWFLLVASCGGLTTGASGDDAGTPRADARADAPVDAARDAPHHASDAAASPNDWSCIGHVTLAPPAKSTLALQVKPIDVPGDYTFPDLTVEACSATDGACASPVQTATTNAMGIATLDVPSGARGFEGFWESQPKDLLTLNFVNIPYRNDIQIDDRQSFDLSDIQILAGSAGARWDTSTGLVGFQIHDCTSRYLHQDIVVPEDGKALASGVSLSIDPKGPQIVYFLGDTASTTATATDPSGEGGFFNVPEGWVTLTASLVATGATIGTARVYSKAGALSATIIAPDH